MFGCYFVADTLTYTITSGNTGNVFGIKSKTGDIYVAKDLDFETPPNVSSLPFNLKIFAFWENQNVYSKGNFSFGFIIITFIQNHNGY